MCKRGMCKKTGKERQKRGQTIKWRKREGGGERCCESLNRHKRLCGFCTSIFVRKILNKALFSAPAVW